MSKKSRANKEKAIATENAIATATDTTVLTIDNPTVDTIPQAIETPIIAGASEYYDRLGALAQSCRDLFAIKGAKSRLLTYVAPTSKAGLDCYSALTVALAVIFERLDKGEPPYCFKGDCVSMIARTTGVFCKHNPDSPLHQGLNRLGGNQFNYSVNKAGTKDTWGSTTRIDLRPVLLINGSMRDTSGEIFLNPVVYSIGGYTRPTNDEVKQACDSLLRKLNK